MTTMLRVSGTGLFRRGEGWYVLTFPDIDTEFHVDRLHWNREELHGQLSVACGLPGAQTIDGWLSGLGSFNLSSPSARKQRATAIAERARARADWVGMLEELCLRVLRAERAGSPAVRLRDIVAPPRDVQFNIHGLKIPKAPHATCLFGDGAGGKSTTAAFIAWQLDQQGERVGYFDWETDEFTLRANLERLAGPQLPDVWYVRCAQPLVQMVDGLAAVVRERELTYAVFDSVGFACGGPPEAAEHAMAYARAVRQLGIGSLHLAHVRQGDGNDQKPFGSAFWHNSFRTTWNLKPVTDRPDPSRLLIGLFCRKNNLGAPHPAVGFEITFAESRTTFDRLTIADVSDLAKDLPIWQRLRTSLRSGPRTLTSLADELSVSVDTLDRTVRRKSGLFTRVSGSDGITRIALLEGRAA